MSIRIRLKTLTGASYSITVGIDEAIVDFPKLLRDLHFANRLDIGFKFIHKGILLVPTTKNCCQRFFCCDTKQILTMGEFFRNQDGTGQLNINGYFLHMILI
tara:strand:- start:2968 stop:3273 length:306 start_codon:yes stop_codon:yes gene_type:complete